MILCFLQNLWVKDPERVRKMIAQHEASEEFRLILIRQLLFYGGLTGRRIKACFGDMLLHMIFEETTREIAGDAKTVLPPDPEHIRACLEKYKPKMVVTFGKVAEKSVLPLWQNSSRVQSGTGWGSFIACPHPAARQKDTVTKLQTAAVQIRRLI